MMNFAVKEGGFRERKAIDVVVANPSFKILFSRKLTILQVKYLDF